MIFQGRNIGGMASEEKKDQGHLVDCKVTPEGVSVVYFLPPERCRSCDD